MAVLSDVTLRCFCFLHIQELQRAVEQTLPLGNMVPLTLKHQQPHSFTLKPQFPQSILLSVVYSLVFTHGFSYLCYQPFSAHPSSWTKSVCTSEKYKSRKEKEKSSPNLSTHTYPPLHCFSPLFGHKRSAVFLYFPLFFIHNVSP